MKIFIDSAKLHEIEEAYSYGLLDGVTTNPSLIKQAVDDLKAKGEAIDMAGYIEQILKTAKGTPVSLEVTDYTYDQMVAQGKRLYERFNPIANNVYIKIPVNPSFDEAKVEVNEFDGLRAIKTLTEAGIPVNCTLIFTPEQAVLAAKAGAAFVSPFAGRIDDDIRKRNNFEFGKADYFPAGGLKTADYTLDDNGVVSGVDLIRKIIEAFRHYDFKTEVLAASIRNARQTREVALLGADIATLPLYVIKEMIGHHKTREGMKNFVKDVIPEYVELTK